MKRCVLMLAGQWLEEDRAVLAKCLGDEDDMCHCRNGDLADNEKGKVYLAAVDGGADYCRMLGLSPDLYLGDFDSVSGEERAHIEQQTIIDGEKESGKAEICTLPAEKDDTDTLAALKHCMQKGYQEFHIFGGLGGRVDHTIANIQCLVYLKRNGCNGFLYQGNTKLFVLKDEEVWLEPEGETGQNKGLLSLFALGDSAKGVSIRGMKYNLEDAVLTNDFPIGISNEFTEERGSVSVKRGEVLAIIQR